MEPAHTKCRTGSHIIFRSYRRSGPRLLWRLDEGKQTRRRSLAKRGLVGDESSEARRGGPLLPAALGSPPCPRRVVLRLAAITSEAVRTSAMYGRERGRRARHLPSATHSGALAYSS